MGLSRRRFLAQLLFALSIFLHSTAAASGITAYKPISFTCRDASGTALVAIRSFTSADNLPSYLAINPQSLETRVVLATEVIATKEPSARSQLADIIAQTTSPPYRLQNHGVRHSFRQQDGMFLTVDLCPSRRPFEKGMFEALAGIARINRKPLPVAVCITGAWLASHSNELAWLKEQDKLGLLSITWVNHSLSHFYEPSLPLARNFMLIDGTDQRREILANEVRMLEAGLTPSPFFRFPGLVADERLIKLLGELSLIPLGADAWLAKGEEPRPGSIILVHGNGNEPSGIARLMKLLQEKKLPEPLPLQAALSPYRP